jgi:hypothetical protein
LRALGQAVHQAVSKNDYIKNKMRNFKKFEKFHFWSIFANFSNIFEVKITFFKKLVEVAPVTYIKFDVFGIYML